MKTKILSIFGVVALVVFLSGCTQTEAFSDTGRDLREQAISDRWSNFKRAVAKFPAPTQLSNFPMRKSLIKFTQRQDLVNHPWYIYVMGMNGEPVGYFIGETYPQNACNFLSSTEDIRSGDTGKVVVTAPSYDGMFYGGGGASGACDTYFTFDVVTDAMYTFKAPFFFASDVPLELNVQKLGGSE